MLYTKLLRVSGVQPTTPEPVQKTYGLTEEDVNVILESIGMLHEEIFPDLPRDGTDNDVALDPNLIWNIPVEFVHAIKNWKEMDLPLYMNPAILLYPIFSSITIEALGVYLERIADIANKDAIGPNFIRHDIEEFNRVINGEYDDADEDVDDGDGETE